MKGIVFANGQRKSSAVIINLNSSLRVTSNLRGEFDINMKPGDTLLTILRNYTPDTTIFTDQKYFSINLLPSAITLKEVNITTKRTTPAEKYDQLKAEYSEIYRKGDVKNMVILSPIGIGINVDKLYNALSTEGKNARKLQRILTEDYQNNVIDSKFKKSFVAKITKLTDKELDKFMVDYRPSFELVQNMSEFELGNYILDSLKKGHKQ